MSLPAPAKQADTFLALTLRRAPEARSVWHRTLEEHDGRGPDSGRRRLAESADRGCGGGYWRGHDNAPIEWQILETGNFRIFHRDPELARRAADVAESVRTAQAKRWASPATRSSWSPRCDLYLYPTSQSYAQGTGQPEVSPGISTMSNNGVRVLSRRMNLRADNPLFLTRHCRTR